MEKQEFDKLNLFGQGEPNVNFAQYFSREFLLKSANKIWRMSCVFGKCDV